MGLCGHYAVKKSHACWMPVYFDIIIKLLLMAMVHLKIIGYPKK